MRRPLLSTLLTTVVFLALAAPSALAGAADSRDYGEGWWGETNDVVVTNFGYLLIGFFPLFIFTMSILQWRLDKRKERRKAAAKARAGRADLRGGW
jgi:hypothetical protein